MGLKSLAELFLLLRRWFPLAFYPKYRPTTENNKVFSVFQKPLPASTPFDWTQLEWPPALKCADYVIDEMSGVLRSLLLGTPEQRVQWKAQLKRIRAPDLVVDDEEEAEPSSPPLSAPAPNGGQEENNPEQREPIERPLDLIRFLVERYTRFFETNSARQVHVVFDYIGWTPEIKTILRHAQPVRPVVWPSDRSTLFTSDEPFQNAINDFFADKEARQLLYEYITTKVIEHMQKLLPESTRLYIWGANREGKQLTSPLCLHHNALAGVLEIQEAKEYVPPRAEADVIVAFIAQRMLATNDGNVLVVSKDSDFLPILLAVLNEHYKTNPDPQRWRVFFSHKVTTTGKVSRAEYEQSLPASASASTPAAASSNKPAQTAHEDALNLWDDMEESTAAVAESFQPPPPRKVDNNGSGEVEVRPSMREVIDMTQLFAEIWRWMHGVHGAYCERCDPLDAFIALVFMAGSDYCKNPPLLTFKTLCHAYTHPVYHKQIGCLCPYDPEVFRVSLEAFKRLLARSYLLIRNISPASERYEDVAECFHAEKRRKDAAKAAKGPSSAQTRKSVDRMPPQQPAGYAARLAWTVNYFTRTFRVSGVPSNGLERDPQTQKSLHGYTVIPGTNPKRYDFTNDVMMRDIF